MNTLVETLRKSNGFKEVTNKLKLKDGLIKINGVKGSAKSFLIDALKKETKGNTIYISSDELEAKKRYEELLTLNNGEDVYLLPSKDIYFYSSDARSSDIMKDRIKVLSKLREGDVTVVMCADALLDKITDLKTLDDYTLRVNLSSSFDMQKLDSRLLYMGYEKQVEVHAEGEYATKGGIIDIFPVGYEMPIRIELWGDDVDSIRYFEVESQKSIEKVSEAIILPAKDILFNESEIDDAREVISKLRKAAMTESNIYDNIFDSLEKVESIFYPENLVNFLFADGKEEGIKFDSHLASVIDFVEPGRDLIICDDLNRIEKKCHIEEELFTDYVISEIEKGKMIPYQTNLRHEFDQIKMKLNKYQTVAFSMFDESWFIEEKHIIDFDSRTLDGALRNINSFKEELEDYLKQDYRVIILTSTVSEGSNLRAELLNSGMHITTFDMFDEIKFEDNVVYMGIGGLETSFVSREMNMVIFAADDLVKFKKAIPRRKKNQKAIDSFTDLNEGDLIVHEKYGIGQFLGIKQTSIPEMIDGNVVYVTRDMVMIRYADGDLGVSVENMNMIQKYIGTSDKLPKLNKRNNLTEWNKAKGKTKESVREIAEKLLKLYAIRENTEGYSFNSDNDYQRQFEDDFAYIETNDQLLAIEDVKKDMESSKVMDRLLCGDVGFGKTEVAIRAAFKAVQDNKQVAILAPTTILVEQHYKTFKQRMKDYPINIEYISRFRTEKEINNALEGLRKGTVDIIIGTHKLLNDKIEFKDLGLLILDEEQRFGVEQKEKIKSKAENVDTLSMSATPIPRTLHMSMSGIRDISLLEEAPRERRPVQTYVMERNEELIKNAIYKEVARNGQVFYLFNRVKGIQKLTNDLRKLMPELRIEYAHGTMPKTEMEAVMREFIKGNIDVLVSTTIIETGIDIPNANTMLVEDADKMGLAQLYQLKGRVGREKRTAFCYFMYEEGKVLSDEADKRLTALKQFTELGSGLKIAMTDLEIRGAGNLIGVEQSGKLGLVGYDLYCKLLEDAIAELKGERVQRRNEIKMNLKIDAYIDEDYIKDSLTKVGLYKRIASIESKEELEEILNELKDRFGTNEDGEVPSNVVNLLYVALLKSQVRKINVRQVDDKDNHVVFTFEDATEIPDEITSRLLLLGQNREDKFRFDFNDPLSTKLYYKESYDEITNERLLVTNLIDLISDITEGNDLNNYFKQNEEKEDEENKPKGIRMRKIRKN